MNTAASFGEWIRRLRKQHDLTREALAKQILCSVSTLRKYESGERRPSVDTATRLANALDIAPEERPLFMQLARAPLPNAPEHAPSFPVHAPARMSGRVPLPPSPLIGLAHLLATVQERMMQPATRLLTLVGPPGIGKTRLATEAAAALEHAFADGVCYVELAPIRDPALVPAALLEALGEKPDTRPVETHIQALLRQRTLLLLLDNCEHLLAASDDVCTFVSHLLEHCPYLKVLATSRAPLDIRAEQQIRVLPLAVPPRAHWHNSNAVAEAAATAFFLDRVQAINADFALSATNAPAVAELCQRLDGIPLAIELIAARAATTDLHDLLRQSEPRLPLLTLGPRDLPARQRTLRDAIRWSYDLLAPEQQASFARLGVFAGGCTADAALHIGAAAIEGLCQQSLVQRQHTDDGELRYGMLESLREFAWEQLQQCGTHEVAQRCRAAFFAAFAQQAEAALRGAESEHWLRQIDADIDNLRAAMRWSLAHDAGVTAAQIASDLFAYWRIRGLFDEGSRWLKQALADATTHLEVPERARAFYALGFLQSQQGDAQGFVSFQHSLALYRAADDPVGVGRVLTMQGMLARYPGNQTYTLEKLNHARGLLQEHGAQHDLHTVLNQLGLAFATYGDYAAAERAQRDALACLPDTHLIRTRHNTMIDLAEALEQQGYSEQASVLYHRVLAFARATADREMLAGALNGNGDVHLRAGTYDQAAANFAESLALYCDANILYGIVIAQTNLAVAELLRHNLATANQHAIAAFPLASEKLGVESAMRCLTVQAMVASHQQEPVIASRLLGTAAALRERFSLRADSIIDHIHTQASAIAQQQLGAQCFTEHAAAATTLVRARIRTVCFESAYEATAALQVQRVVKEALAC